MHDVGLAYVRFDTVTGNFLDSLVDLLVYDRVAQDLGGDFRVHSQSLGLVDAANGICQAFVDSEMQYLFWLDGDMGFAPDTARQLRASVNDSDRPIVSALTFKYQQTHLDGYNGYLCEERPVIMDWVDLGDADGTALRSRKSYPENALVRCDATGMACVMIHRSVHEAILEKFGPVWHSPIAFGDGAPTSGQIVPEAIRDASRAKTLGPDVSFWMRASLCDFPIYVHTGVGTNHQKATWLSPNSFRQRNGEEVHGTTDLVQTGQLYGNLVTPARGEHPQNRAARRRAARAKS